MSLPSAKQREPGSRMLASDFESFRQQELIFVALNLGVFGTLLLVHTLFSSRAGPSPALIAALAGAFGVQLAELAWLKRSKGPFRPSVVTALTTLTIVINFSLAIVLAEFSHRQDIQYYVVLLVPILEAAFRLSLAPTIAVISTADLLTLFWVWEYERRHLVSPPGRYLEAAMVSFILLVVGIVVWLLVNNLEQREAKLGESLSQLERARERLLGEEKLAAVGRLSSAIAHEIRNPVAVITSALSTANRADMQPAVREEMRDIAVKEAARLEKLTTDFLAYARPRGPKKAIISVPDTLSYVVDICRVRAHEKGVALSVERADALTADIDAAQVQEVLINLVMNAVEASPPSGKVKLRATVVEDGLLQIDVKDAAGPIPGDVTARIFEPFFTTKPGGTGLGLAIARNIVRAHGGDLLLSENQAGSVTFSVLLAGATTPASGSK